MTKMVALLEPLERDVRRRVIQATLTLLGDEGSSISGGTRAGVREDQPEGKFPRRAESWIRQHDLSEDELNHVFHVDGDHVEIVASRVAGKTNKERTLNAYILSGAARLLASGEPAFDDAAARESCRNFGCYDHTNHATYMKHRGNTLAGSKDSGWKLTAPGLTQAAALVKEMSKTS